MTRSTLLSALAAALVAFAAPTAALALSLVPGYGARSLHSHTSVTVAFENCSNQPIQIFWRDYEGRPKYYATIQPGATLRQQTYASHPWELRQHGRIHDVYTASSDAFQEVAFGRRDSGWAPVRADGYSVRDVDFGDFSGRHLGQFVETRNGSWIEIGDSGQRFFFDEIGRDEWSVYLQDPSRGVWIQLDLHRKEIFYRGPGELQRRTLYRIVSAR